MDLGHGRGTARGSDLDLHDVVPNLLKCSETHLGVVVVADVVRGIFETDVTFPGTFVEECFHDVLPVDEQFQVHRHDRAQEALGLFAFVADFPHGDHELGCCHVHHADMAVELPLHQHVCIGVCHFLISLG